MQKMDARVVLETPEQEATYEFHSVAVTSIDGEVVVTLTNKQKQRLRLTFARADLRQLFGWKDMIS